MNCARLSKILYGDDGGSTYLYICSGICINDLLTFKCRLYPPSAAQWRKCLRALTDGMVPGLNLNLPTFRRAWYHAPRAMLRASTPSS